MYLINIVKHVLLLLSAYVCVYVCICEVSFSWVCCSSLAIFFQGYSNLFTSFCGHCAQLSAELHALRSLHLLFLHSKDSFCESLHKTLILYYNFEMIFYFVFQWNCETSVVKCFLIIWKGFKKECLLTVGLPNERFLRNRFSMTNCFIKCWVTVKC